MKEDVILIKKEETRIIYDKTKVNKGDIVEWDESVVGLFKPKVLYRNVGVVSKFEPETLWVTALGVFNEESIGEIGLPVERTDVTVLKRHPINEQKYK